MVLTILNPPFVALKPGFVQIPAILSLLSEPWIVKPSRTMLSASMATGLEPLITDSAPRLVLASTPACAPRRVRVLSTTTFSLYVPAATVIVSPLEARAIAPLIVVESQPL
jgi:hypothetical protein